MATVLTALGKQIQPAGLVDGIEPTLAEEHWDLAWASENERIAAE